MLRPLLSANIFLTVSLSILSEIFFERGVGLTGGLVEPNAAEIDARREARILENEAEKRRFEEWVKNNRNGNSNSGGTAGSGAGASQPLPT